VLPARACLEHEPALRFIAERIVGGVWTPTEAVGDSGALTRELIDRAVRYGAELRYGTAVTGVEIDRGAARIRALVTPRGADAVDQVVIANGSGAARLGRLLGLRLPVYPIKGYSVTLPLRDPGRAPTVSVTDAGRKTVYAPLPGRLRVAGFAELVGDDLSIDARRINQLLDAAAATFPGAFDRAGEHAAWAGLRPATPTSLPIIGATRWSNVWLNVGHGTLGFTLAMGSAQTLKQLLVKRTARPSILPQPAPAG
jgi:D-amino-acid dehydrogenase